MHDHERPICTKEAARFLGIAPKTLEQWRWKGIGPAFHKMRRAVRYQPGDLRDFLSQGRCDPGAALLAT